MPIITACWSEFEPTITGNTGEVDSLEIPVTLACSGVDWFTAGKDAVNGPPGDENKGGDWIEDDRVEQGVEGVEHEGDAVYSASLFSNISFSMLLSEARTWQRFSWFSFSFSSLDFYRKK